MTTPRYDDAAAARLIERYDQCRHMIAPTMIAHELAAALTSARARIAELEKIIEDALIEGGLSPATEAEARIALSDHAGKEKT